MKSMGLRKEGKVAEGKKRKWLEKGGEGQRKEGGGAR